MAFLDNSGDIILDAVLTDKGRKRMARGNFKVVKFALGDDEIDYGLYNKDHPSGSAYYDLEILQTPILEAFTQANASLNYGLISYARNDLLYLPTIVINEKKDGLPSVVVRHSEKRVIFLADDNKTNSDNTVTSDLLNSDIGNKENVLVSNDTSGKFVFVETGLNGADAPLSTSTNQNTYLLSVGLNDNKFAVQCDKRFIGAVLGQTAGSNFSYGGTGTPELTVVLQPKTAQSATKGLNNYKDVLIEGVTSRLYAQSTGDTTGNYSAINGARGAYTAFNFKINSNISQNDFSKYGRTAYALFGTSNLYDYIDTIVYVRGINTNIVLQVPIRIIQASQS